MTCSVIRRSLVTAAVALLPLAALAAPATSPAGPAETTGFQLTPQQQRHWAYQPPRRPALPRLRNRAWAKNPIDLFILAKLERAGLTPAPPASKAVLLRRVAYDLTGLPPSPEEIDAFLADRRPDAYERVVERLLASPRYGERWARHWLDVVRYADTNGYEHDEVRPDAWRYRDYVVRAFNEDKPYDQFVREQLAGDELWAAQQEMRKRGNGEMTGPSPSAISSFPHFPVSQQDALIATGFALLGPDMTDAADQATRRQISLNDATDTVGLAFLGMTVGCARCHDHKYEAIPQTDYYRLQAFFSGAEFRTDLPLSTPEERRRHAEALKRHRAELKPLQDAVAALEGPYREEILADKRAKLPEDIRAAVETPPAQRNAEQKILAASVDRILKVGPEELKKRLSPEDLERYKQLQEQIRVVEERRPDPLPVAIGLGDRAEPVKTFLLERGDFDVRGPEVTPGFPVALGLAPAAPSTVDASPPTTGLRARLAEWLVRPDNPLTARVMVNRLWQGHFGRGLVGTPSDFGERGERPSHPELLDYLATAFVAGNGEMGKWGNGSGQRIAPLPHYPISSEPWSLKAMHYLMVTSATYRQSSTPSVVRPKSKIGAPTNVGHPESRDPENRLLSHMNRRRLEGEAVRDAALAVSGLLNPKMGGPGVFPPLPEETEVGEKAWPVTKEAAEHLRRSLYIFVRRNVRYPLLETFDSPDTNLSCARREASTTAPQALALLNSAEVRAAARALADRVAREAGAAERDRIVYVYRLTLGRPPSAAEVTQAAQFLARHAALLNEQPADGPQAALDAFCLALLNANEFVYVD